MHRMPGCRPTSCIQVRALAAPRLDRHMRTPMRHPRALPRVPRSCPECRAPCSARTQHVNFSLLRAIEAAEASGALPPPPPAPLARAQRATGSRVPGDSNAPTLSVADLLAVREGAHICTHAGAAAATVRVLLHCVGRRARSPFAAPLHAAPERPTTHAHARVQACRACLAYAAPVLGLVYMVSPLDLIPDWIPIIGWIDDALVLICVVWWVYLELQRQRHQQPGSRQ